MFLKITDNFYRLDNIFPKDTLDSILDQFKDKTAWVDRPDSNRVIRLEGRLASRHLLGDLDRLVQQLVPVCLYPNNTQLWYDPPGYMNVVHRDLSPNLAVNVQIYLTDGDINAGTHCYDNEQWYSVPYQSNSGYLMIGPTKLLHGMKSPVKTQRLSLYQSYRTTIDPIDIW